MVRIKRREDIILSSGIIEYFDPTQIFLPVDDNEKILVKKNERVLINQRITDSKYSSISGKVEELIKIGNLNCLVINNDYKENSEHYNDKLSVMDALKSIAVYDENRKYDTLLINVLNSEPYIRNYEYILNNYLDDLLDTIDLTAKTMEIKKVYLLIGDNYSDSLNKISSVIGTYPNIDIKIIKSDYPIMNSVKEDELFIDIFDVYSIKCQINEGTKADTVFLSVAGNAIKTSGVVQTKRYVKASDLINEKFKLNKKNNYHIIINGLLSGYEVNDFDFIIDTNVQAIFIMEDEIENEHMCINCGECIKNCPINNNPKYIMQHPNKKSSKEAIKKCLHCNTCSYVCPAKINLSKYLGVKYE